MSLVLPVNDSVHALAVLEPACCDMSHVTCTCTHVVPDTQLTCCTIRLYIVLPAFVETRCVLR